MGMGTYGHPYEAVASSEGLSNGSAATSDGGSGGFWFGRRRKSRWGAVAFGAAAAALTIASVWYLVSREEEREKTTLPSMPMNFNLKISGVTLKLKEAFAAEPESSSKSGGDVCLGWCPASLEAVRLSHEDCAEHGIQRLKAAFQIENCAAATKSDENKMLVESKILKLVGNSPFVFFRGAAAFFDYNMMCATPSFLRKKREMPRVKSNGDCHPENFGVMVQGNGKLRWGVNDFDQAFKSPFSWDVKRGAVGFILGCLELHDEEKAPAVSFAAGPLPDAYDDAAITSCAASARAFSKAYVDEFFKTPDCSFKVDDMMIEGSRASQAGSAASIVDAFRRSRAMEAKKATRKWLAKYTTLEDGNSKKEKNIAFKKTKKLFPLPRSVLPEFQKTIDAYLFHGVGALAVHPNTHHFYRVESVAEKRGSGTGSIGLNRYWVLISGRSEDEDEGWIILEIKEEVSSVLEAFFLTTVTRSQEGERAATTARDAYPYTNIFYGWTNFRNGSYIIREKSKHKESVDISSLKRQEYMEYAAHAGASLAHYHSRVRCPDLECKFSASAAVDKETCRAVGKYISDYPGGAEAYKASIVEFAAAEAKRQVGGWRDTVDFVNADPSNPLRILDRRGLGCGH